ncbi:MAG: recombinase family protein [Candidatus Methanomethyliaceae archaeon]
MRRAGALYRQSTLKQESIPYQQNVIHDYVNKQSDMILLPECEYVEEGVSAYKISKENRDVLQEAFVGARQHLFDTLLVFKSDRLSRIALEYPLVLREFHNLGVRVVSVADGGKELTIEEHIDILLRFVEGWQAEGESKNTSIRVRSSKTDKAKDGRWSGGNAPYGFALTGIKGKPLRIDEDGEANIVKLMVSLYKEGRGFQGVAIWLNNHGYKTRNGLDWDYGTVRYILQNPIIAGLPAYGRSEPGGKIRIKDHYNLANPRIIVPRDEYGNLRPIPELQIITLDDWLEITTEMQRRAKNVKTSSYIEPSARSMLGTSLLTGFLKCGYCQKGMVHSGVKSGHTVSNGKDYYYPRRDYICLTRKRKGKQSCPDSQASYSQRKIDSIVIAELEHFLKGLDIAGLEKMVNSSHWAEMVHLQSTIKTLEKDLKKYEQIYREWGVRLDAYLADSSTSLYPEDYIAAKIREYAGLIATCKSGLDDARKQLVLSKTSRNAMQDFVKLAPQWFTKFLEAPIQEKKRLLKTIVRTIDLYRDRIVINYHINLLRFANQDHHTEEVCEVKYTTVINY